MKIFLIILSIFLSNNQRVDEILNRRGAMNRSTLNTENTTGTEASSTNTAQENSSSTAILDDSV